MRATVLYYSHRGTTARYAREIAMYLWSKGFDVGFYPITEFEASKHPHSDYLLLGCWTSGWFIINQHPQKQWVECARRLAGEAGGCKVLLFTTYRFRTGSMFQRMAKALGLQKSDIGTLLKSRTGILTDCDKSLINKYIENH